jgi:peptidyl-prolyl cis-trans isomerase C
MRLSTTSLILSLAVVMFAGTNFAAAQSDPVLAKVNGTEIHQSDLALAETDVGEGVPPGAPADQRRALMLQYLVNVNLLSQAAEKKGLDKSADFSKRIAFARKKVLVQALMEQESKNAVSDAAIKKFYDEKAKVEPEVHARHILVETEDQAKDIAAQLKKGANFEELANKVSKDPGSKGGDLGYITKDQVVPEFGNAAFALAKGKVSEPVKSQFGWHIIKVEDKRDRKPPPFEAVKEQIKAKLSQDAREAMVKKIHAEAKIEDLTAPAPAPADDKAKKK